MSEKKLPPGVATWDYPEEIEDVIPDLKDGVVLALTAATFSKLVSIGVIVESYMHVTKKACGSKRRKYLAAFTEDERKVISRLYYQYYRWYLLTGVPPKVLMKSSTLILSIRACQFLASI